ncbi:4'-phosphopantetheinyl transferase superfamily protein [Streptomyces sp. NPDC048611]|uniref:4'-phosphopantetheinyl transferase family protein n=1 Tax=Streptomyces sp. NPDC048611 TaxID=3155635 RepID=UPI00343F9593
MPLQCKGAPRAARPALGEVHVWWAHRDEAGPHLPASLDDAERARLVRLRRAADRDRFLVGRALIRLAFGRYLGPSAEGLRISTAPRPGCSRGAKPWLPGAGGLEFSLSHSGAWIVLAVGAEGPLGVDIEERPTAPVSARLMRWALSPREREELGEQEGTASPPHGARDPVGTFLHFWVAKEAVLKATGEGLTVPFHRLTLTPPGLPLRIREWQGYPGAGEDYVLCRLETPRDCANGVVAVRRERGEGGSLAYSTVVLRTAAEASACVHR